MLLYLHLRDSNIFFHPAKFDNFKDEKISDFKTVSVSQRKKCWTENWWSSGIRATFEGTFLCFGGQHFFESILK